MFEARVSSVTKFGLFAELDPSGAHALVPMGLLPDDRYDFDTSQSRLEGRRWGRVFSLAQRLSLRLVEADGLTGSLVAEVVGEIEPSSFESLRPESQKSRSKSAAKSTRKKSNARRKYQRR